MGDALAFSRCGEDGVVNAPASEEPLGPELETLAVVGPRPDSPPELLGPVAARWRCV
jgi:hypothetical protein